MTSVNDDPRGSACTTDRTKSSKVSSAATASSFSGLVEPDELVDTSLCGASMLGCGCFDFTLRGRADRLFVMSAILLSMNLILRYCERDAFSAAVEVGWLCTWKVDCFDWLLKDEPARTPFRFAGERSIVPG